MVFQYNNTETNMMLKKKIIISNLVDACSAKPHKLIKKQESGE